MKLAKSALEIADSCTMSGSYLRMGRNGEMSLLCVDSITKQLAYRYEIHCAHPDKSSRAY